MKNKSFHFLRKNIKIVFGVLFLLIVIILLNPTAFDIGNSDKKEALEYTKNDVILIDFWEKKIDEYGIHKTYDLLAELVKDKGDYGRHLSAHQFGEALYKKRGIDGIEICDDRFGHGCFHQFFISALRHEGEELVKTFEVACIEKIGLGSKSHACFHGMGHGVMSSVGGEDPQLALDTCKKLDHEEALYACIDGVFMEYYSPTKLGLPKNKFKLREINLGNPYHPCPGLDAEFQDTCYWMQASWWLTEEVGIEKVAELCRNTPGAKENSIACFKGMGHTFTLTSLYNKELVIEWCKEASHIIEEETACRSSAHWAFSMGEEVGETFASEAEKDICGNFSNEEQCLEESQMFGTGLGISVICCSPTMKRLEESLIDKNYGTETK